MSGAVDQFGELGPLAAALCDGEITPPEAARLEQLVRQSPEARRLLVQYVQLHGELYWDLAAGARPVAMPYAASAARAEPETPRAPVLRAVPRSWIAAALAASLLVAVGWWAIALRNAKVAESEDGAVVAQLGSVFEADWATGEGSMPENAAIRAGEKLELRSGLAEIVFRSGARVLLQGPATLDVEDPMAGFLHSGRLSASVPPEAIGFTLRTPDATVTDLGTEFGLIAQEGGVCEIHTFVGQVRVTSQAGDDRAIERGLVAGQALRVSPVAGGATRFEELAAEPRRFVRDLLQPGAGSVAAMRRLVSRHPRLIHHYTFEGTTALERYRDRQGSLHLTEVVMSNGRGEGSLGSAVPGFDATTNGVAPYRAVASGNSTGVALQSEAAFQPPPELTVEVLLKARPPEGNPKTPICVALATRESPPRSSFFLAAVDRCQLTHLMDADAPWVETEADFAFIPDHWYYVASTFHVESNQTRVNTYVADLSQDDRTLNWIVKDRLVPGTPGTGRLGIGKGFDENGTNAYPWSGELDEVALYDAVLDRNALEEHLLAILAGTCDPNWIAGSRKTP